MRKFIFSLKSLAMTLALVVGGSAWAQITSLPFVADFSSGAAPFGEPAFKTGTTAIGDVVAVTAGTAEATFAVGGGAYALGNAEEVTVSFTMFNGWLGGGTDNTFAVLNSDGATLASISYNANNCNIVDVKLGGSTVEGFEAFAGQSKSNVSGKGANGYTHKQTYVANTDEAKNNGEVTIKINSYGGLSLSFVGAKGDVDKFFSATAPAGTKLDLAKLTISNGSNNGDRASGYGNLSVTSKSMIKKFQDYSDGVADWTSGNTGRYTVDMNEGKYLTVNAVGNGNNGTTITGTTVNQVIPAGEDFASSDNFTMSFDLQLTGGNNQASSFYINDAGSTTMLGLEAAAVNSTVWKINGSETQTLDLAKATWYSFKLTKSDAKLYLTVVPTAGGDALMNQQLITVNSTVGGLGNMIFNTKRYYAFMAIDNVLVRDVVESEDIPATPIYTYTVKYVDQDDSEFKDPSIREEYEGVELAITDDDKATVVVGNSQYTYVSDDAAGQTAASDGSTVITVKFNKTTVTNYTVNFFDTSNGTIKDAVTHKNVLVGTEVSATAGEMSKILKEGVFYEYTSGNNPITLAEDAAQNVINLYFAPVDGVTGYFFNNYENRAVDWTTSTGGRYDPIVVNGSTIADRATTEKKPKTDPETGEPIVDPETGEPEYEDVPGLSIPFANKSYFLTVNQAASGESGRSSNGATLTNKAISVNEADFTFEAKILLGSSNNQNGTNLQIKNFAGDANIFKIAQKAEANTTSWIINDDAENFTVVLPNSGTYTGTDNNNLTNYNWYDLKVTVYNGTTFVTIVDQNDNVILDKAQVPTSATTYGVGNMVFATSRYYANFAIDDVTVRSVVESEDVPAGAEFVAVKINYVDEAGTPVKPADEAMFQIGQPVVLNSAFTADFKVDAEGNVWTAESESAPVTKYIYVSDNSADVTAALDAQVNIVFRGVGSYRLVFRYQIQKMDGNITHQDANEKNLPIFYDSKAAGYAPFEGDKLTFYYPRYVLVDGLLYQSKDAYPWEYTFDVPEATSTYGTQTKYPITWTPAMETGYVIDPETGEPAIDPETQEPVTEEVQIKNAVFAQETENIEGITVVKDGFTSGRMANGAAGSAIGGDVLVTTLEPGTYTITTATRSGTTNFKAAGNVVATVTSSGVVVTTTSEEFTVDQATPLYIEEQASTTQYSDYVLVRKTKALESYKIAVAEGIVGGTIEVASSAAADAEITITATPDEDYELSSISVTCAHKDLAVIVTDGKFTMPDDDVTVNATFRKVVYLETDLTADFISLTSSTTWKSENASGVGQATWSAPQVTVAGNKYYMIENYVEGQAVKEATGGVMYNEITGLTPGLYTIELYGSAALTAGRSDMTTDFTEGDDASLSAVYLYAEANGEKVKKYIPCLIESNFNNRGGEESIPTATLDNVVVGNDGKIKIGLYKEVGLTNWHIVQLKKVTAKVSAVEALASAVAKAKAALNSEENAVIVGEERTALESAIENYSEVTEPTAEAYKTAVDALQTATNTFTSARAGYAALASTKETFLGYAEKYVYASADKTAAVDAAAGAVPTSAADATSINTNLITALRAMAESHAIAEGVEGAEPIEITNPSAEDGTNAWTVVKGEGSGGDIDVKSNEPWTSADESTTHKYFDGGNWGASAWDVSLTQDVELEPGKYLLSAIGRASGDVALSLFAGENKVAMPSIGAAGGIFNRGWNITSVEFETDAKSTVTIGVQGVTEVIHNWMSFSDFKLVCLERYYAVNIAEGITNGTVTADPTMAAAGETVTLTVTPAEGYELASISVTGVTSNIAVEAHYDSWSGTAEFEMPADAVTVNATFQEAYVEVSDFAIASTGIFDEDGTVKVTGTFTPETAGSYTEMFFGDVIYDITVVPTAGGDAVQYTLNIPNDKTLADGVVSAYIPHLVPATNYTVYVDSVHVWDYLSYQEIFVVKAAEGEHLTSTTFTAMPQTELADLNVERYVGQGYTATTAEVDFSAAKTFLGVDEITSDMLYIINPDLSQIKDYAKYDGWFDGDGKAETWGDKTKINVKFYQALTDGKYTICDMNGADVVDNTYTVRWALVNNFKAYVYTINVKFVEQPVIYLADYTQEGETVDVNIYANTGNVTFDGADSEAFQESAVSTLIGEDWEDVYGVGAKVDNQETMTDNYSCDPAPGFWCLADGTADQWANGTFGVSLIWDDSFSTFNFRAWTKGDISDVLSTTFYLVNNNTKKYVAYRVILNTVPTGIDATPAADGVKPDGKYLENGKIVIYRNGNKYDASGAPMNK